MGEELDIEEREALRELEHDELVKGLGKVVSAIGLLKKDDPELKKLLSENSKAINNFVEAVSELKKQEKQEIKVETNQDKVVKAMEQLGEIIKGFDKRFQALESRPLPREPKKLVVTRRNGWNQTGTINEITIEYDK